MAEVTDDDDMTDQYNTLLTPPEERRFHQWQKKLSAREGRDTSKDLYDYDQRGLYKSLKGRLPAPGHGPDTYKKPNHETFSNESIYQGRGGAFGGHWDQDETGSTTLQPYDERLKFAQGGAVLPRSGNYLKGRNKP